MWLEDFAFLRLTLLTLITSTVYTLTVTGTDVRDGSFSAGGGAGVLGGRCAREQMSGYLADDAPHEVHRD